VLIGVTAAAITAAVVTLALVAGPDLTGGDDGDGPRRAAIVDQLSLSSPNPEFVQESIILLERNNYEVDYFPGEEVTVEL